MGTGGQELPRLLLARRTLRISISASCGMEINPESCYLCKDTLELNCFLLAVLNSHPFSGEETRSIPGCVGSLQVNLGQER